MVDPMLPQPYRVRRVRKETHDTFTIELEPEGTGPARVFSPGQFNMIYAFGTGEAPISMSGRPWRTDVLVHTVRRVGSVTRAVALARRGDVLGVRGPFGSSWPMDEAVGCDVVAVAGGIGLAPLRSALYSLFRARGRFGRILLLYGARNPNNILYLAELKKWRRDFDVDVQIIVDAAAGGWGGDVGVVTKLIPRAAFDAKKTLAMICGPEVMMRFTVAELCDRGVDQQRIFLSLERNMKCAVGFCGHCQFGPTFICKDGPVFRYDRIAPWLATREI